MAKKKQIETCTNCKHEKESPNGHCTSSGCMDGIGDGWEPVEVTPSPSNKK